MKQLKNRGFTLVELMIALMVLSTILVIGTVLMIQIGSLYTKGVNSAKLQSATRNITQDVTSAIQFSGSTPAPCPIQTAVTCAADQVGNVYSFCIDTSRYSYVLDLERGTDSDGTTTQHVLWRDTMKNSATCHPVDMANPGSDPDTLAGTGFEMMPDHMRLTRFKILETPPSSGVYNVDVWMAYGDKDLVVTDSSPNPATAGHNICQGGPGTQFCAVSNLSTIVKRRIQ